MKLKANQKGSALIVVMIVVAVLSGLIVFMLEDASNKFTETVAKVEDAQCFNIAEGGVDLAIAELNLAEDGKIGTDVWNEASDDTNNNGRPDFDEPNVNPVDLGSGEVYAYSVNWFTDGVDNDGVNGVDDAAEEGYYTIYSGARDSSVTRYGTTVNLEVIVVPVPTSLFRMAMFGDDWADVGGTAMADSYDSDVGTYISQKVNVNATTGLLYAKANGDVGSNGNITASGTVDIYGKGTCGAPDPGPPPVAYTTTEVGGAFIDGDTSPAPEVVDLPVPVYTPTVASSGACNSNTTLNAGTHRFDSVQLMASKKLTINGDVTLYVDGEIKLSAMAEIEITPGAKLTLYHGSGDCDLSGHGLVNSSTIPANFIMHSSSTDVVKINGSSDFHGAVYAPAASVTVNGTSETFGAFVGNTMKFLGTSDFHYDEALGRIEVGTPVYAVKSWRQLD